MAIDASPLRRLGTAWWSATKLLEQAVSSVMLAPRRSKKSEILAAAKARPVPVLIFSNYFSETKSPDNHRFLRAVLALTILQRLIHRPELEAKLEVECLLIHPISGQKGSMCGGKTSPLRVLRRS